jgi:hypothetical protein
MRRLLGTVTVSVTPRGAAVAVDGEDLPAGAIDRPLLLGPGTHKIAARAPGYTPAEQRVAVASGRDQAVSLALAVEAGLVTIEAGDPRTQIAVDDVPLGAGTWSGPLPAGAHTVTLSGAEPRYTAQIQVVAGVPQLVRRSDSPPPRHDEPPRRGFYVLGLGSVLAAVTHPHAFGPVDVPDYGAGYGVRAGFQVNKVAGFDLTYEHSSISSYAAGTTSSTATPNTYRIIADRVVVGMRLISPGSTLRFVGNFGGGFVNDQMFVNLPNPTPQPCAQAPNSHGVLTCFLSGNSVGVDAFALGEAGLEVDIDRVLLDFVAEGQLQSTGNLQGLGNISIFGSLPLVNVGAALRFGYRFW